MRATTLALLAALLFASQAAAPDEGHSSTQPTCQTRQCAEKVARKRCSNQRPVPCVRRAALHWRVSEGMIVRKAWCESRMNPAAISPAGHLGLFQFAPGTWEGLRYRDHDPLHAKWNALAAGFMHHLGRGGEWACL